MKRLSPLLVLMILSFVTLAACKDDKNPAQQYGNTMVESYKKAKDVDSTVNVQQVQKSIQEFHAANGRYPADLSELAAFNGMTLKSDKYEYDPATGALIEKQ
jgi:outer membrane protein assembly factor BamD (BamD/ComL family)